MFGYTSLIDVSAREQGRRTWPATPLTSWLGKSFDTFAPIGPCIATADEIKDPNDLIVRFWNDGQLRHNYNTDDMEHRVPELVEWATTVMTMNSGDLIACGTNHEGLGFLQDGETVDIEIQNIGKMTLEGPRSAQAHLGARRLHGRRLHQPGRGEAPSPAGRSDRDGRDPTPAGVPDAVQRGAKRSGVKSAFTRVFDALWLIRDRSTFGVRNGPGSAAHRHSASKTRVNALMALRCARDTR